MNSKYFYALAGLLLGLTACSNEELMPSSGADNGETVFLSLTVDRSKAETRTVINEQEMTDGIGLSNVWAVGDQIVLVSADGNLVSDPLSLQSGATTTKGVFSGKVSNVSEGVDYNVYYLGAGTTENPSYANFDNGQLVNALASSEGCSVSGKFEDLNKGDLLKSATTVQINVASDGTATVSDNVQLEAQMAMAHFTLSGDGIVDALKATDAKLSFTYGDFSYSISNVGDEATDPEEVYVPMIPGTYKPYYTFTLEAGAKKYTYSQANENENAIVAGLYYNGGKDNNAGDNDHLSNGINVSMTPQITWVDNTVGPTFTIGQKKYRFTSGNLWYNYSTQKYGIYDTQIEYLGKWYNDSKNNPISVIDLFSWATTGLDQSRAPEYFWTSSTKYGGYFPTEDDRLNAQISDVVNQYDRMYDFGYAYMQSGREENDKRDYRIPTQDQLKSLFDGSTGCFFQGCTVKENGKDIYGTIVIPKISNAEAAKALIDELKTAGEKNITYSSSYLVDASSNGKKYNVGAIIITGYDQLKKLNNALFFPAAGHIAVNQGTTTSKQSHYWSGNAVENWTSQRNAYGFYYDTSNGFRYNDLQGAYMKCAVRLLVEVDD